MAKDWIQELNSESLKNITDASFDDEKFSYTETLTLLENAAVSGFSSTELSDLRLVYSQDAFESDYVKTITYNVLYDNTANAYWWGGSTKLAQVQALGNIADNIGNEQVAEHLVKKWFLGEDLPMPISGGDTANPDASAGVYTYGKLTGDLFLDGISPVDVNQGQAGTCYVIAAMESFAYSSPNVLQEAFTVNPNGTIGVKFYYGGNNIYTTVNYNVPQTDWGTITYTGNAQKDFAGEAWASLMEKAYIQANAEVNLKFEDLWTKGNSWVKINGEWKYQYVDYENARNSYKFMEGGFADPLKQLSGLNFDYWRYSDYSIDGDYNSLTNEKDHTKIKADIIKALDDGGVGWIAFWGSSYRKDGVYLKVDQSGSKQEAVGGHAFALHSYDEETDTFLMSNPWTQSSSSSFYNTTFSLPIEFFWDAHFRPLIGITDPTSSTTEFNYSISSNASTISSAENEGEILKFTVSRDASGQEQTIYISTEHVSTSSDDIDPLYKKPVTFSRDETSKIVEVTLYADGVSEDTEAFKVNLFKKYTSTTPDASVTAYVKDVSNGNFNYTIANNASSSETAVAEGGSVDVTITRDGDGSVSTIYLGTRNVDTDDSNDLGHINFAALEFTAKETVKTVSIPIYEDTQNEGIESFEIFAFDSPGMTTPIAKSTAYIKDLWTPEFSYNIFSSAATEAKAVSEGDDITFTIMRTGSGATSKVHLKSFFNNADFNDLVYSGPFEITFSPNEALKTFTIQTTEDLWLESTESFGYNLYTSESSTIVEAKALGYIKDKLFSDYEYSLAPADGSELSVNEGNTFVLNITRNGEGEASTVYISTRDGTATADYDYESVAKQAVVFSKKDTIKSLSVEVFSDSAQEEETENFWIDLFLNENDTSAAYSVKIDLENVQQTSNFSYDVSNTTVNEGETATFTITRDGTGEASTIWVATSNETADTNDYAALELQSLTFSAKETTKSINVETYFDTETEGSVPEYFWLDLYKDKSDYQSGDYASYGYADIVDITDENATSYSYEIENQNDYSVTEGETASFTITRSASGSESTIYVQTSDGTADQSDFTALAATAITFSAKETTKTISVETVTDSVVESSEYFYVDLYETLQTAEVGNYLAYDYMYITDATSSSVSYTYSVDDVSVTEGEDATFTVTRDGSSTASTVYVSTTFDTADANDITTITAQEVVFSEGETSKNVTVETLTDSSVEGAETFYLDVFSTEVDAQDGNYIAWGTATLEDATSSSVAYTYSVGDVSVTEGEDATFTVTRDGSSTASTVYVSTTFETADANDITTITAQEVVFSEGETSKNVTVETLTDSSVEGAETFYLDVFSTEVDAQNGNYIAWGTATLEDATSSSVAYTYSVGDISVTEGEDATFTITRDGSNTASTVYVSTTFETADANDITTITAQEVVFGEGETSKNVTVETLTDSSVEGAETFYLDVFSTEVDAQNGNYIAWGAATLEDAVSNSETYSYAADLTTVTEGDTANITITKSGGSAAASSVYLLTWPYADITEGVDYQGFDAGEITFDIGETTKTFSIDTYTDNEIEGTEYFYTYLYANYSDAVAQNGNYEQTESGITAYVTVLDGSSSTASESYSYSADLPTVIEGDTATVTITKTGGSAAASSVYLLTWPYADITEGVDYQGFDAEEITFDIGETTKTFSIDTYTDNEIEGTEYFYTYLYANYSDAVAQNGNYEQTESGVTAYVTILDGSSSTVSGFSGESSSSLDPVNTFYGHDGSEFQNAYAFARLSDNGTVITWGDASNGGNSSAVAANLTNVSQIHSNHKAFAAVKSDGSVVAWGNADTGGDLSAVANKLDGTVNVTSIASTKSAFAALMENGSVIVWGSPGAGGDFTAGEQRYDIASIFSNTNAFAALTASGEVIAWGQEELGGNASQIVYDASSPFTQIYSTTTAFAAVTNDGSVSTWGSVNDGGDSSSVASKLSNVASISSTSSAFAALLENGSVVTWGNFTSGADSGSVALQLNGLTKVEQVFSNDYAFAALRSDGSVVTWGSPVLGGDSSSVASDLNGTNAVTQVYSNGTSFLAVHEDSTITTWGLASHGGDSSSITNQVDGTKTISSVDVSETAYTILFQDGSFVTWGDFADDVSSRIDQLVASNSEISSIEANNSAFFALDSDGNTIAWGDTEEGGTYSSESLTLTASVATPAGVGLSGVSVSITQEGVTNAYTSGSSGETVASVTGSGSVVVSASLDYSSSSKAVTSQDALEALRLSVGLQTSTNTNTAFDYISADFNQDGKVTSADALDILKYSVGLQVETSAKWVFIDNDSDYSGINKSNTAMAEGVTIDSISVDSAISLTGILIGDVNDTFSSLIA